MAHTKNQLLVYLDGHGERNLEGIANHDLGEFGKRLKQNGFRLNSLNLALISGGNRKGGCLNCTRIEKTAFYD